MADGVSALNHVSDKKQRVQLTIRDQVVDERRFVGGGTTIQNAMTHGRH